MYVCMYVCMYVYIYICCIIRNLRRGSRNSLGRLSQQEQKKEPPVSTAWAKHGEAEKQSWRCNKNLTIFLEGGDIMLKLM